MSLLGFDAVGRQALGQLPTLGLTNTVLLTVTCSYTIAGTDAAFRAIGASSAGAFAISGILARFGSLASAAASSYIVAGNPALFRRALAVGPGAYAVNGPPAAVSMRMPSLTGSYLLDGKAMSTITSAAVGAGAYAVTGYPSSFVRDFEAWFARPIDSATRTGSVISGETWTSKENVTAGWTAEVEPSSSWTPATIQPESWDD